MGSVLGYLVVMVVVIGLPSGSRRPGFWKKDGQNDLDVSAEKAWNQDLFGVATAGRITVQWILIELAV